MEAFCAGWSHIRVFDMNAHGFVDSHFRNFSRAFAFILTVGRADDSAYERKRMGVATTAGLFGVAGTTMSYYQSQQQAQLQKLQAELDADSLEAQASRKDLEAAEALKLGELEMAEQRVKGRAEIAEQKVAYAASGVKVDSGSTLDVMADKAAWSEYERQKIEYESKLTSWGLSYDAALLRQESANTRAAGVSSGSGLQSVVSGGNAFFSMFK